jgi:hypothetical protein
MVFSRRASKLPYEPLLVETERVTKRVTLTDGRVIEFRVLVVKPPPQRVENRAAPKVGFRDDGWVKALNRYS